MLDIIENLNKLEILFMSGISSAFITHIFYSFKLKSEQKIRFQNIVGDRISESLIELRELVKEASEIERYDIVFPDKSESEMINAFDGPIYPAIMADTLSLSNFLEKINDIWEKNGDNLDCKTALHLWYASRYFAQLIVFIGENNYQNLMPKLGAIFIVDIQKWYMSFDKVLIKRINKSKYKLEFHQGIKWRIKKGKLNRMWENSLLHKAIYNSGDDSIQMIKACLEEFEISQMDEAAATRLVKDNKTKNRNLICPKCRKLKLKSRKNRPK